MKLYGAYALLLVATLTACGENRHAAHPGAIHFAKGQAANLAPNSDSLGGWTLEGYKPEIPAAGKSARAVYVGTGKPNSADLFSQPVAVVPGQSYLFSAWIDPSHTIGTPVILVASTDRLTLYGRQIHVSGAARRFSDAVTIPDGVTRAVLAFTNAGGTTPRGKIVIFSQPMFRADGISRPYKASSEMPLMIFLAATGKSKESGSATIRDGKSGARIVVSFTAPRGDARLSIVRGLCGGSSASWRSLAAPRNGFSTTVLPGVTLAQLKQGTYSLVVSAGPLNKPVACGILKN